MSHDDHRAPREPDDAVDAGIKDLLAGPSPVNMVHGAIELDGSANGMPRPSQAAIDAARNDVLAALWGLELYSVRNARRRRSSTSRPRSRSDRP